MTPTNDIEKLDAAIAKLEAKLQAYRALREVLTNTEAADEVRSFFAGSERAVNGTANRGREPKVLLKLQTFFENRGNEWATIGEMAAGTKMMPSSVRQALYKGHADKFDRDAQIGGGRVGRYRLKK
jgi:hypothetical protein